MLFLIVASYFIVFSLGIICTKMLFGNTQLQNNTQQSNKPESFLSKASKELKAKIEIDERKFVTDIETDSLEKKFNDLGKVSVSKDETISNNISKLAALKKSKE